VHAVAVMTARYTAQARSVRPPADHVPALHGSDAAGPGWPSSIASNRRNYVVWRYGLEIVPPLVTISEDVSWQLGGMSRWARLVLS